MENLFSFSKRFIKLAKKVSINLIEDSELDYFRGPASFRNFVPFISYYLEEHTKGRSFSDIAQDFPSIRIDIDHNGQKYLSDGRHRYIAAWVFDVKKIMARIVKYNTDGWIISDKESLVELVGEIPKLAKELKNKI